MHPLIIINAVTETVGRKSLKSFNHFISLLTAIPTLFRRWLLLQ